MISDKAKKKLQKQAMDLTMKLMSDDRTRPYMAKAMQSFMVGRETFVSRRDELLDALDLASQKKMKDLNKRVTRLSRRLEELNNKLQKMEQEGK